MKSLASKKITEPIKQTTPTQEKRVKICVYAICKNESKFVEKWLDNMSEADYIVVLDTGSTDDTYEKLKADPRVTRVEQKIFNPWRFDVARNESMKLVPDDADVLLSTDFDELFEKPGWSDIIRHYWDPTKYNRFFYNYAWSHTPEGEPSDVFKYDKIHTRDFHWVFPVHEVLWPNDDSVIPRFLDCSQLIMLHHYMDMDKPRNYYFDLLKLAVEENPRNPHEQMLLAREYLLADKYEDSLREYLKVLEMRPEVDAPEMRTVLLESLERAGDCYRLLNNFDEAIWYYQEFIKEDPTYREPYLGLARIYITMKMYTLAEAVILAGLKYSTRKYIWIEQKESWISEPDDLLAETYACMGNFDDAIKHVEKCLEHHPNNAGYLKKYNTFLKLNLEKLKEGGAIKTNK